MSRYNIDGGLEYKSLFMNPRRFMLDVSSNLSRHATALVQSFPHEEDCSESVDEILETAGILKEISQQPPQRVVAYVYLASAFAAEDHYSWLALVVLDNVRRKIHHYLRTVFYAHKFPSALDCNTDVFTSGGPPPPEKNMSPTEYLRAYVEFVWRGLAELEREPYRMVFNAPGQVIISIQEFLSRIGRPGVSMDDRERLSSIKLELCGLQTRWNTRLDILDIWFKSYFGSSDFRYWVLLCHCLAPLYWTRDPADLLPLHHTLDQYQPHVDRLEGQLTQLRALVDTQLIRAGY